MSRLNDVDQVVAIGPGIGPDPILVVAMSLGEMNQIHPVPRPALAIMRTGEQAIDQPFIGVGRSIARGTGDLLGSRRQADQVEREPADQGAAVGLGRRLEILFLELGEDEGVDRVPGPCGIAGSTARNRVL